MSIMNYLPRRFIDIIAFVFLILIIPLISYYELIYIVPVVHDTWSSYAIALSIFLFILFNTKSNMLAVMMIETSVKEAYPTADQLEQVNKDSWRMCDKCETLCPPRSWHCDTCKICILKRDHHCLYTGKCVGLKNHRYFFMLIVYFLLGTLYLTVYNTIYMVYNGHVFFNSGTVLKMLCPIYFYLANPSIANAFLLMYEISIIGLLQSFTLFVYHSNVILNGGVTWEINKGLKKYDLGWKNNLKMIFGERMYLVWISPFIESKLPVDGIHWD